MEGLGDFEEELELLAVEGDAADFDRVLGGHNAVPSVDTEQAVAVVRVAERVAELHVGGVVSVRRVREFEMTRGMRERRTPRRPVSGSRGWRWL